MKAAIVLEPGKLTVRDVAEPQIGDYDALCELLYGATCSGTDTHLIKGHFPWPIKYPTVLGHESVGRVVKVGPKVRHFKIGDLVTRVGTTPPDSSLNVTWGGFTQLGIAKDHWAMKRDGLPASQWSGYRINQVVPPGIDPIAATMIITLRETWSYTTRLGVKSGSTVLIVGSGGNGLAFAVHARNLGAARVVAVGSAAREAEFRAAGVHDYIDYHGDNLSTRIAAVQPDGFQFIIDAVGKTGLVDSVLPNLAAHGTVAIYGIDDYHNCSINPNLARGTFTLYRGGYDEEEAHEAITAQLRGGAIDAKLWFGDAAPYPLERIADAFDAVAKRRHIKAVIKLNA
ncbi:MAG: alcohol dehydrogenase catalytic domain-containing protein [Planctomycetes bacterium]|nr:alcohol dehydrogenase catalytic domain-containing protein [Planctomycetota bacterium]